jgi:hypothetical protein
MHEALHKTDAIATDFRSARGNLQSGIRDIDTRVASVNGSHFGDGVALP